METKNLDDLLAKVSDTKLEDEGSGFKNIDWSDCGDPEVRSRIRNLTCIGIEEELKKEVRDYDFGPVCIELEQEQGIVMTVTCQWFNKGEHTASHVSCIKRKIIATDDTVSITSLCSAVQKMMRSCTLTIRSLSLDFQQDLIEELILRRFATHIFSASQFVR
jgi:hypothetical protein